MRAKNWWLSIAGLMILALFVSFLPTLANGTPPPDGEREPAPGAQAAQSEAAYLRLANSTFDPLAGVPDLPESLAYTPEEAAAGGDYIIQFAGPVRQEWKEAILQIGGQLGSYLPEYAFLVHFDADAKAAAEAFSFVRWVGAYQPAYKLAATVDFNDTRSYRVLTQPWADAASLERSFLAFDSRTRSFEGGFAVVLNGAQLSQAAHLPGVLWIEPIYLQTTYNDIGGGTIMGGSTAWSNGYTGSGVVIAVTDTGLDVGDASNPGFHLDFAGRTIQIASWPVVYADYGSCEIGNGGANDGAADVDSGHGSHVTGSVAGSGARSSGQIKGLAYEANITFQAVEQYTTWSGTGCPPSGYYLTGIPDDVGDLLTEVYGWGARIQNNSWGGGTHGDYDTQASQFDDFVHNYQDMTVVVAAGNDGIDSNADGYIDTNSISSPGTSKNLIVIGASDNERATGGYAPYTWYQLWGSDYPTDPTRNDYTSDTRQELAAFSSRGPMEDGRIKPDLVAPGTNILSVRSSQISDNGWGPYDSYYMYMGGTSMASPLSAGAAALVRDYYVTTEGHTPTAALIKATLINTAVDITGYGNASQEAGMPIPNNHEGWGLINVAAATTAGNRAFEDNTTGIGTGATASFQYTVAAGTPFKVSLVWSDAAGSPAAGAALVNNLNLRVTAPGGTSYLGNVFSGGWSQAGGTADSVNNVENVYIQSPTAGLWTVEVIGGNVPQGPQSYALFVTGSISTGAPLNVTAITPESGYNSRVLSNATITGTGFDPAATVSLRLGAATINGTNVTINAAGTSIEADFNLAGAAIGLYDVRVDNPTEYDVLADGFQIFDSTLPDLYINKTAAVSQINAGNYLTYTIHIENIGLTDATSVTFTDTLPVGVTFTSLDPACEGGRIPTPGGFACMVMPTTIGASEFVDYTLVVFVPTSLTGNLVNAIEVVSFEEDANPADNADTAIVAIGTGRLFMPMVMRNHTLTPRAPTLAPISNPDGDGNYTLSWTPGTGPAPTSYDIEENGVVVVSSYTGQSYGFTNRPYGTHTYRVRGRNAVGAGPWSAAQSATVLPPVTILNGDFEYGADGSWTEYSNHGFYLILPSSALLVDPHSGNWAVWLGGYPNELSTLTQQVYVPTTGNTLSFYYWIASQESNCNNDIGRVYINTNVVATINLCGNTNGWNEALLNLSAYAGQSVSLQFYVQLDGSNKNSNLFLDDVSFK